MSAEARPLAPPAQSLAPEDWERLAAEILGALEEPNHFQPLYDLDLPLKEKIGLIATKVYGAALLRLRARDFGELVHKDGISPAWPLPYESFEPYYGEAEKLFAVLSPMYTVSPIGRVPAMLRFCGAVQPSHHMRVGLIVAACAAVPPRSRKSAGNQYFIGTP